MILMWLGTLVLMLAGLEIFRRRASKALVFLQRPFSRLTAGSSVPCMAAAGTMRSIATATFVGNLQGARNSLISNPTRKRFDLLWLCTAAFGFWPALLGGLLAGQVSGFYVLGFSLLFYLPVLWWRKGSSLFEGLLGLGIFLVGAEMALRQQTLLLSLLGDSEIHFLLADGRFPAQMLWLVVACGLTLILRFESWSLFVSLLLVNSGSLSLNGAVALMLGEVAGHLIFFLWKNRAPIRGYAVTAVAGFVLAFLACGGLRELLLWQSGLDLSQGMERSLQVLLFFVVILAVQTVTLLLWGHFAAKK